MAFQQFGKQNLDEKCILCGKPFGNHRFTDSACPRIRSAEDGSFLLDGYNYGSTFMREEIPNLKEIVKDNTTEFSFLRAGYAFYTVAVNGLRYMYPVELADLQNASIFAKMKAITMMRYIRKALEDGSFVREGK